MELQVTNVGPVSRLSLPIPEGGGVVVLKGRNGVGKSTVLDAAESLIRGKGSLAARDGAAHGSVEGWGARITVGKQTRRSGALDVVSLEGRLDIAQLVDPGILDPAAADARRIKALATLTGATASRARFAQLFVSAEEFEAVFPGETTDDLVETAGRVKRAAEAEARKLEDAATRTLRCRAGLLEAHGDLDLTAESDATKLQAALEAAVAAESALQTERTAANEATRNAEEARASLERVGSVGEKIDSTRREYDALEVAIASYTSEITEVAANIATLKRRFAGLSNELEKVSSQANACKDNLESLEQAQAAIDGWRQTIAAAAEVRNPSDGDLAAAANSVVRAREAIERGAEIRRARENEVKASAMRREAASSTAAAARLREAARATDDVLSEAVACDVLRVESGQLVTDTCRGTTLFSDLSHGERWAIALRLAADRVGEHGVIPVPQEAWEGLDPDNRLAIAEKAAELNIVILTAEADSGPLRAEPFAAEERES